MSVDPFDVTTWPCPGCQKTCGWNLSQNTNAMHCANFTCSASYSYKNLSDYAHALATTGTATLPPRIGQSASSSQAAATQAPAVTAPRKRGTCIGCGKPGYYSNSNFCSWNTAQYNPTNASTHGCPTPCGLVTMQCSGCAQWGVEGFSCVNCGMLVPRPISRAGTVQLQTLTGTNTTMGQLSGSAQALLNSLPNWSMTGPTTYDLGDMLDEPDTEESPKLCIKCGVEWCEYLDAYHGPDKIEGAKCSRCRR